MQIDEELLDAAAALDPRVLRSLDAIHLAAAQLFGDDLDGWRKRRGWLM